MVPSTTPTLPYSISRTGGAHGNGAVLGAVQVQRAQRRVHGDAGRADACCLRVAGARLSSWPSQWAIRCAGFLFFFFGCLCELLATGPTRKFTKKPHGRELPVLYFRGKFKFSILYYNSTMKTVNSLGPNISENG